MVAPRFLTTLALVLPAAVLAGRTPPRREITVVPPMASEQRALANELAAQLDGSLDERATVTANATSSGVRHSSASSFPKPFDAVLSSNWTASTCPVFFQTFLADSTFQSCLNMWLLLETSTAFFQAEKTANVSIPPLLDAACSDDPGMDACAASMGYFATKLQSKDACAKDLQARNPLVQTALQGFQSYALMREATCSKDNTTGSYCFLQALENDQPDDLYLYQLPAGTTLPSNTQPTCDACSAELLNIYSRYASNSTLAISSTYSGARSVLTMTCGPTFAPRVVTASSTTGGASSVSRSTPLLAVAVGTVGLLLQALA